MSWKEVFVLLSPVLSSPKPYQVPPTLMMPRPCSCSGLPLVSFQAAPGVKVAVAACAGVAADRDAARAVTAAARRVALRRRRMRVELEAVAGLGLGAGMRGYGVIICWAPSWRRAGARRSLCSQV